MMCEKTSPKKFIAQRIEQAFNDLAEMVGDDGFCKHLTADEVAGLPATLFYAEMELQNAWTRIAEGKGA